MSTVQFEIHVVVNGDLKEISEPELAANFAQYHELLQRQKVLTGALVIAATQQPLVRIDDELWAAVQGVCFASVEALLEQRRESYIYRFENTDAHVVMIPLASQIRLIGEYIPVFTDAVLTLLPALFRCGARFVELLNHIGGRAAETAQLLEQGRDRARNILQGHSLL